MAHLISKTQPYRSLLHELTATGQLKDNLMTTQVFAHFDIRNHPRHRTQLAILLNYPTDPSLLDSLWKLDPSTSLSFSTESWLSTAWWGQPDCAPAFDPPNDKETCVFAYGSHDEGGLGNTAGRLNDATCNYPVCALCEIEI